MIIHAAMQPRKKVGPVASNATAMTARPHKSTPVVAIIFLCPSWRERSLRCSAY